MSEGKKRKDLWISIKKPHTQTQTNNLSIKNTLFIFINFILSFFVFLLSLLILVFLMRERKSLIVWREKSGKRKGKGESKKGEEGEMGKTRKRKERERKRERREGKKGENKLRQKNLFQLSKIVIWLILPVVICLSKRLSHASASDSLHLGSVKGEGKARDDCERLIKTVIGSGWSEENGEDKGVKIELKRGRGILTTSC